MPHSHVVRLHTRSSDRLIGRLIYGRRPKGVESFKGSMNDAQVSMYELAVYATAYPHSPMTVDFHLNIGSVESLETMVRLIGGKTARIETMTEAEWLRANAEEDERQDEALYAG